MRVAIVNDLALAREVLRRLVVSVPGYSVAWMAADGAEAVRRAGEAPPDVVLMDLVMPVMDGAEATRRIMAENPCPVLLVTSSVTGNFNLVYKAMGHGGLDAVNTPTIGPDGKVQDSEGLLARLAKLQQAQQLPAMAPGTPPQVKQSSSWADRPVPPLVALGSSTGGPEALAQILSRLPADFPAGLVIVQHIAAGFLEGLAEWLATGKGLGYKLLQAGALSDYSGLWSRVVLVTLYSVLLYKLIGLVEVRVLDRFAPAQGR